MHRGKVADALLPQIIIEQEADIAIISEQYTKKMNGVWSEDETATAAIWIPPASRLISRSSGKGNGFVWALLDNNVTIVSCYLTPSDSIEDFQNKLDEIEDNLRALEGPVILAGDFNARSPEWGTRNLDSRGKRITQMAARVGLTVANKGNVPTFRRPGAEGTIPDVTLVSDRFANRVKNWRVLEIYTASDHQYISYSYEDDMANSGEIAQRNLGTRKWNSGKLNTFMLIAEIDRGMHGIQQEMDASTTAEKTMRIISQACDKAMPKISSKGHRKKPVYWWNETIAGARQECLRLRRRYTRARKRGEAETERIEYKEAKKNLRSTIFNSKKQLWEELREDINNNPWGTGYKLVMGKLGAKSSVGSMDGRTMDNIVKTLFPQRDTPEELPDTEPTNIPQFTQEELNDAARKLKANKSPGPDGIPAEVIKEIAFRRPEILLRMYNACLKEGVFPKIWKRQQLVLISKGKGDPESPSAYRPLCMLDTAGKLYERLIKPRLNEAITAKGGLSARQHGFRPKRSTIGAVSSIVDAFEATQNGNHSTRPLTLLAALDVKNAFNSLRWPDILQAIEERFCVPAYLSRVIRNYLKDRELIYNTAEGQKKIKVTSGAAQGSILGPDLWNVSYDEIFDIELPHDTFLVGYADDIAAVIMARDVEDAKRKLRQVIIRTRTWLDAHGLQLAAHKTELLILTKRHIPVEIDVHIDDLLIRTKRFVNYLGIRLDSKLTFSEQVHYAAGKATKITGQLSRLMANIGGPLPNRRKLLMEASNSVLLYGSEIWGEKMNVRKRANALLAVQRSAALRVTSAYRTVSGSAVLVIAGMIPIDLQILERRRLWTTRQINNVETEIEERTRYETLQRWQERWNADTRGRWTQRLIPNIEKWVNRHRGDVNYYLTQMLSGHGYFRGYLHRMKKCSTPYCLYENEDVIENAEHTFFTCSRWTENRRAVETITGPLTAENIIDLMTTNEENWRAVAGYCETILRTKKTDLEAADLIERQEPGRRPEIREMAE